MEEGILIYGLNNDRRKYTRDLQTFADKVLKKYREQIENNKIKKQQNGKTKEIRLRFR